MKSAASFSYTPPILGMDGKPLPNSIAEARYLEMNDGDRQWIMIRGHNVNVNPLLLLLHGGPGVSETVFWRYCNSTVLERYFTVVYWDQRGSGKSYDKRHLPDAETMTVDQFLTDLHYVVTVVCDRCHTDQVVLFGHSWGSVLGPLYAQAHPERVAVYVGCGQLGDWAKSETLTYQYALTLATEQGNRKAIRELEAIGPPPHDCHGLCTQRNWLHDLDGDATVGFLCQILYMLYTVPETNVWDVCFFWTILRFSAQYMWREVTAVNLITAVPQLTMPTVIFLGRNDHCVFPQEVSMEFINNLQAPSKQVVWFEESKHEPFIDEPDKFNNLMVELVRPIIVVEDDNGKGQQQEQQQTQ